MQNATLNTKGGVRLTSHNVLKKSSEREVARAAAARARVEREAAAVNRCIKRDWEAEERIWARDAAEGARIAHVMWMSERGGREMQRQISRGGRKSLSRQSALPLPR